MTNEKDDGAGLIDANDTGRGDTLPRPNTAAIDRLAQANAHRPKLWMCPDCHVRFRIENAPNHADHCHALQTAAAPESANLGSAVMDWHQAALIFGEQLAATGPQGYYGFTAAQWLAWVREQFDGLRETATSIADIAGDDRRRMRRIERALRQLSFMAQTSCGTAGRDDLLMAAIADAERALIGSGNQDASAERAATTGRSAAQEKESSSRRPSQETR